MFLFDLRCRRRFGCRRHRSCIHSTHSIIVVVYVIVIFVIDVLCVLPLSPSSSTLWVSLSSVLCLLLQFISSFSVCFKFRLVFYTEEADVFWFKLFLWSAEAVNKYKRRKEINRMEGWHAVAVKVAAKKVGKKEVSIDVVASRVGANFVWYSAVDGLVTLLGRCSE